MRAYSAFDDAHVKTMGDAFDFVCTRLHGINYPPGRP